MNIWIHILILAVPSVVVYPQTCPSEHFSAVLTATIDQTTAPGSPDDPELIFFKAYMKFRDSDIQHTTDDAIQFFNNTYGLDFSDSPNEKNERFFQNARMSPFILSPDIDYILTDSYWVRNGDTRSSCYHIRDGGFRVTFSGNQTLHGSYGGAEGKPAGIANLILYGFYNIDVCEQSPLIIQFQASRPFRTEPIDGISIFTFDLYNYNLGYGKSHVVFQRYPDPNKPGQVHVILRNIMVFPSQEIKQHQ